MPELYVKQRRSENKEAVVRRSSDGKKASLSREAIAQEENISKLSEFNRVGEGVRFETQALNEKIILLLRAHPITNVPWIVAAIAMAIVPTFFRFTPLVGVVPDRFSLVIMILWYLITFAFVFEQFLNWYFNVYIVTDERIIDIDFVNILYKRVSETKLDKIQDVTYSQGGVVRSLFNYGNVYIQTAAESREFEFNAVPNPNKVAEVLRALVTQEEIEVLEGRVS